MFNYMSCVGKETSKNPLTKKPINLVEEHSCQLAVIWYSISAKIDILKTYIDRQQLAYQNF